jgi:hypothetical protein
MRTRRFHEKTWVWVPDADKGYVSSWVMKEDAHIAECMGIDDKIRVVAKEDYSRQNPPKASGTAGNFLKSTFLAVCTSGRHGRAHSPQRGFRRA